MHHLPTKNLEERPATTLPSNHHKTLPMEVSSVEGERQREVTSPPQLSSLWTTSIKQEITTELRAQGVIAFPLAAMNLTWFAKTAITTAFLGQLGDLQLAGGTLGFTFANVTGFSVLNGLSGAMEPICGQAHGAKNYRLLRRTLFMAILLLLTASIPIAVLWLNLDKILIRSGQQRDELAKKYIVFLLPDLVITSFLCPLKSYLSSQAVTLPTFFSSAIALAIHIPLNILLSKAKGLQGVAMAVCLSDLSVVLVLASYIYIIERKKKNDNGKMLWEEGGGWWDKSLGDLIQLLKLSAPCCLTTCLEWWCWEIMVLLTGRLPNAQQMVAIIAIVLNFDYLLFSIMLSMATCASVRVSNELGAGYAQTARRSAYVSVGISILMGFLGALATMSARGHWGSLFSHNKKIIDGVRKMMTVMALVEVVNCLVTVCGGIVRGTARPWLGMYANLGGFYLVALPLGVVLAFIVKMGLGGLLFGFLVGSAVSAMLLTVFVVCINWTKEAEKAERLTGVSIEVGNGCGGLELAEGDRV